MGVHPEVGQSSSVETALNSPTVGASAISTNLADSVPNSVELARRRLCRRRGQLRSTSRGRAVGRGRPPSLWCPDFGPIQATPCAPDAARTRTDVWAPRERIDAGRPRRTAGVRKARNAVAWGTRGVRRVCAQRARISMRRSSPTVVPVDFRGPHPVETTQRPGRGGKCGLFRPSLARRWPT